MSLPASVISLLVVKARPEIPACRLIGTTSVFEYVRVFSEPFIAGRDVGGGFFTGVVVYLGNNGTDFKPATEFHLYVSSVFQGFFATEAKFAYRISNPVTAITEIIREFPVSDVRAARSSLSPFRHRSRP